jgi:hypothetical protein
MQKKSDQQFWGIVVYDILEKGLLLNGLWTNIKNQGETMNEIARKFEDDKNNDWICGKYKVCWLDIFEKNNGGGILKISKTDSIYDLEWNKEFVGKGSVINNQLIAIYWSYGEKITLEM